MVWSRTSHRQSAKPNSCSSQTLFAVCFNCQKIFKPAELTLRNAFCLNWWVQLKWNYVNKDKQCFPSLKNNDFWNDAQNSRNWSSSNQTFTDSELFLRPPPQVNLGIFLGKSQLLIHDFLSDILTWEWPCKTASEYTKLRRPLPNHSLTNPGAGPGCRDCCWSYIQIFWSKIKNQIFSAT